MSDSITDTAIIEEEIDYLLFLTEQEKPEVKFLKPKVKFLSIESTGFTTPKGWKDHIKIGFSRIDTDDFSQRLCNEM